MKSVVFVFLFVLFLSGCGGGANELTPCEPRGTWNLTYDLPRGGPAMDVVEVQEDAGGKMVVTFPGRPVPLDSCVQPTRPGRLEASGELSADGCTVTVRRAETGCTSGENQCERLEVSFGLGPGEGAGTFCRCWDPGPSCVPATIQVRATRRP